MGLQFINGDVVAFYGFSYQGGVGGKERDEGGGKERRKERVKERRERVGEGQDGREWERGGQRGEEGG